MDEVIAQFEKNATEVVRVSITEYRGHKLIDLRVYYSDDEGQYRPTKKGISVAVGLYADFKQAMQVLEKALLEHNLITQEDLEEVSVADPEPDRA
jgi:hypothetical protein